MFVCRNLEFLDFFSWEGEIVVGNLKAVFSMETLLHSLMSVTVVACVVPSIADRASKNLTFVIHLLLFATLGC